MRSRARAKRRPAPQKAHPAVVRREMEARLPRALRLIVEAYAIARISYFPALEAALRRDDAPLVAWLCTELEGSLAAPRGDPRWGLAGAPLREALLAGHARLLRRWQAAFGAPAPPAAGAPGAPGAPGRALGWLVAHFGVPPGATRLACEQCGAGDPPRPFECEGRHGCGRVLCGACAAPRADEEGVEYCAACVRRQPTCHVCEEPIRRRAGQVALCRVCESHEVHWVNGMPRVPGSAPPKSPRN